jgi:hypothetical protein
MATEDESRAAASSPSGARADPMDPIELMRSELPAAERRRLVARGLLRAMAATTVLVVLYFTLPLYHLDRVPIGVSLLVALLILLSVTMWQVRAITRAAHPGVRAVEALAVTAPLFLLLFAATYFERTPRASAPTGLPAPTPSTSPSRSSPRSASATSQPRVSSRDAWSRSR